jgi:hypothetical protein
VVARSGCRCESARTRLIWRQVQVRSVGWAVHIARERQFCAPGLSALPMLTATSQPHSAGCTRCERNVPADKCRRRHMARPWPGGRSTADGVAAVGPENLSATLADDRGIVGHGPCEGAWPEDLPDSWHGHGAEAGPAGGPASPGGSTEQAGGRSAPGEVGDLRLDSFRVTPCSRKTAPAGSRPGRAGSKCSPAIGWHRFSEPERR